MLNFFEEDRVEVDQMEPSYNWAGRIVEPVELPRELEHIRGQQFGRPAPGDRVSVDTPLAESQRPFYPNEVIKNLAQSGGLDWNLFGYATVVRHSDGTEEIIDAQHRVSKVKTILPDCKEVPAHIIYADDPEYVATLFWRLNATRHVTREERLWAEVVAREPRALEVRDALIACDLACGRVNQGQGRYGGARPQIKLANFEKCLKFGLGYTQHSSDLIQRTFPRAKRGIDQLLSGLTRLISLDDYQALTNDQLVAGQRFTRWFTQLNKNFSVSDLNFKQYHNTSQWYNGTAYGLARKFRRWQGENGYPQINLKQIKEIYLNGIKRTKDDEDEDE